MTAMASGPCSAKKIFHLALPDPVLAGTGAVHGERALDQPFGQDLGALDFVGVIHVHQQREMDRINSGILTLTGSTSGLTGNIVDTTNLVFAQSANSAFNGTISGSGNVSQNGSANLTLAGANTYGGLTTVNSGTLTLSGSTNSLTGNIVDNSNLVFAQTAASTYSGVDFGRDW